MIHIRNPDDLHLITDLELRREAQGYLSVCIAEFLEYEDEADLSDHNFNFLLISDKDIPYVNALGPPEEYAVIELHSSESIRTIYRVIYVTEVLFIPGELADRITIL